MMKYVMLLSVATLAAAIIALADVVGVDNIAHAQAGVPSNVSATNGANPGEVVVSWDPVAGALEYRVGWLAVPDYQANIDNDRWRERFAYSDVNASSSYTVTRLTPGVAYYFITGRKQDGDIAWSQWATLTLNADMGACPASAVGVDYDDDDDGLVEVRTLAQLDVIRLDLDGDSLVRSGDAPEYLAAFPGALDYMGCPADGCKGYELADHLDFDTNGNGEADAGDAYWNDGAGWEPIGNSALNHLQATFDGNGYTIANLYINRPRDNDVGLFGYSRSVIRNVVLDGVDVTGRQNVGGLVGGNARHITDSTASGSVSGERAVGGLVGTNSDLTTLTISISADGSRSNGLSTRGWVSSSTASGTVSGDYYVGGLVGGNSGHIRDSTASGTVSGDYYVGGLVGANSGSKRNELTGDIDVDAGSISNSTASGDVSGNDYVGGLVGLNGGTIEDSTASGNVAGVRDHGALVGANDGGTITNSTGTGTVSTRQ